MLSTLPLIALGQVQLDEAMLGPLVTVILISLIIVREVLTSLDKPVRQAKYLDIIIAPLVVVFALLVFLTIS